MFGYCPPAKYTFNMNTTEIEIVPVSIEYARDIQYILREASRDMYLKSRYSEEDFAEKFKDSLSENSVNECANNILSLSGNEKYILAVR